MQFVSTLTHSPAACLRSLHFDNSRYENIVTHHDLTLGWFLECKEYNAWMSSKSSSMLFVEGKAGSGKSTLVRFVRDRLHASKSNIIADFFYSARDGELHRSHKSMLRSLLYHILDADESCFVHFQETYRSQVQADSDGATKWSYKILKDILQQCSKRQLRSKLILIVDALDESDDSEREDIVTSLWNLAATKGNCLKICFASRPINDLPKGFHSDPRCHHLLLQERNKQDIGNYTQDFLRNLSLNCESKAEAQQYIINHADGVFVWVHLIEKDLKRYSKNGCNQEQLMRILKTLPTDLKKYYEFMLLELRRNEDFYVEYGIRIFQFCLFSHRRIDLAELREALAISLDEHEFCPRPEYLEQNMSLNIHALVAASAGHFVEIKTIPGYNRMCIPFFCLY